MGSETRMRPPAADYAAIETSRDGRRVLIRAIRTNDADALLAAVRRSSEQSRFRRFFSFRNEFSEREIRYFVDVDFQTHVALVALAEDPPELIGGARYIRDASGSAEMAFTVVDHWQRQGVGAALLQHLARLASGAGLRSLQAEVLPDNQPMLKVFQRSGFPMTVERRPDAVHVTLALT
jgi:RimJ/RimL family protein N-acetyltransferase